jgi:excisionase family DNA binding protein
MLYQPLRAKQLNRQGILRRGVSPAEAARYLNIGQSEVYMLMQRGQLRSQRSDGQRLISRGALMEYQARKKPSLNYW